MTDNVDESLVPSRLHLSYVLSITIPQPTIRIRIPKALAKAMQRKNNRLIQSSTQDKDENDGSSSNSNDNNDKKKKKKKKKSGACRKSLRKKAGAMFSNVFGNKKTSSSSPGQTGDNSEVDKDVERSVVDTKELVARRTRNHSNDVVQETAVATGLGLPKSLSVKKETSEAGDEGKEGQHEEGRTVSKSLSRRTIYGVKKANINKANDDDPVGNGNNNSLGIILAGNRDSVGTRSRKVTDKAESDDLLPTVTRSSRRKLAFKVAWSMKRLMGKESGKRQLCNKRILMGGKCKPLGTIQYDENGFLLPEILP